MVSQTEITVGRQANALRDFLYGVPAELGKFNDDGTLNRDVSIGLPAPRVWIRIQNNRTAIPAININVTNKIAGANVLARRRPDSGWEVITLDPNTVEQQFGEAAGAANQPDRVKEWDTIPVESYRLTPGRITASTEGGLFVYIEPFIYKRKRRGGLHLLIVPPTTTGDRAFVVISFDPADDDDETAFHQIFSESVPGSFVIDSVANYLLGQEYVLGADVPDAEIILGGVLVANGDSAVNVSQIVDAREWIDPPSDAGGGATAVLYDKTLSSAGLFDTNTADDYSRTGIDQTYTDLIMIVHGAAVSGDPGVQIYINGDTNTAHYVGSRSIDSAAGTGGQSNEIGFVEYSGGYAALESKIHGYSKTGQPKHLMTQSVRGASPTRFDYWTYYDQSGAITRIQLRCRSGVNFEAGTRLRLLGVK